MGAVYLRAACAYQQELVCWQAGSHAAAAAQEVA